MQFPPPFTHLIKLSTDRGLFEHALLDNPRPEHGYCVDDVSRALILLSHEKFLEPKLLDLFEIYLDFILKAISEDGRCHNRMDLEGNWTDTPTSGDWWGRAIWALGFVATLAQTREERERALGGFRALSQANSPHFMANSFAALGAGQLLKFLPEEESARKILRNTRLHFLRAQSKSSWNWPLPRLEYSNGSLVEAALIIGASLQDSQMKENGILMLELLLRMEIKGEHFSPTPVGGRGPTELGIGFDQQPIEIAAIASACAQAWRLTKDPVWIIEIERAWQWFLGNNDSGLPMFNSKTGGGYDGLEPSGINLNQGAESTIAMLSTAQEYSRSLCSTT